MRNVLRAVVVAVCFAFCAGLSFAEGGAAAGGDAQKKAAWTATSLISQTVVSVNPQTNSITVKDKDGVEQEIALVKATRITEGKKKRTLSDISAGEKISIYFKKAKDGQKESSTIKILKEKKP